MIIFTVVARSPSSEQEHHYCDHRGMSKTTFITHLKAIKIQFPTWKMPIRARGRTAEEEVLPNGTDLNNLKRRGKELRHAAISNLAAAWKLRPKTECK